MKNRRRLLILLLAPAFFCSCENRPALTSLPKKVVSLAAGLVKRAETVLAKEPSAQTNSATAHLDHSDEELARIAETARDTLPDFFIHLLRPGKGEGGFRVKYPFRADSGSPFSMEQLWLEDLRFKNGVYYGVIANTPFYITSMKKGDTVSFSTGDITDWMYTKSGKIIGGRSIKHLLEQIAEPEQSEEQRAILKMFEGVE